MVWLAAILALGCLFPMHIGALSNRDYVGLEIICGSETQGNVVDLSETKSLVWTLKDARGDCEVTFKVPPRQNFKIWLESGRWEEFYVDGNFIKG